MTPSSPVWLLPVLPTILVGVSAGSMAYSLATTQLYPVLVAGLVCSSLGFLLSLPMAAIYFHHLFVAGLPDTNQRPGTMIAVGPPGFAPLAFLKIARWIPHDNGHFTQHPAAVDIVQIMAFLLSLAASGMSIFSFSMAFCAILRQPWKMTFHRTWNDLVVPNVGLLSTLCALGTLSPSNGVM